MTRVVCMMRITTTRVGVDEINRGKKILGLTTAVVRIHYFLQKEGNDIEAAAIIHL